MAIIGNPRHWDSNFHPKPEIRARGYIGLNYGRFAALRSLTVQILLPSFSDKGEATIQESDACKQPPGLGEG